MSKHTNQRSVLIVGKSQRVIDDAVAQLHQLGYDAAATNNFDDVTRLFDVRRLDVVVFGGQVPSERKAELTQEISAVNPRATYVHGLSGIPGLIVAQVEGAFATEDRAASDAPTFDGERRTIHLTLARPADVKATAWWVTSLVPPDPKSDSLVLLDHRLAAGDHELALPDVIPHGPAFASVCVDEVVHTFALEST
jgi:hypothetical protein